MNKNICFGGIKITSGVGNFALLIVRVFLGLSMIYVGLGKLSPSNELVQLVDNIGFPMPEYSALIAGIFEVLGGAFLVLGLFTRWGALMIMIVLFVALVLVHGDDTFSAKFLPLLVFFNAIQFVLMGAGNLSVDAYMRGR